MAVRPPVPGGPRLPMGQRLRGCRDWHYRPRLVVDTDAIVGCLFTRAEFHRYYFGDYYAPEVSRLGFVPWFDHRMSRGTPDPLFRYAHWQMRKDPQWEVNLRTL